jgi:hypothetical protein
VSHGRRSRVSNHLWVAIFGAQLALPFMKNTGSTPMTPIRQNTNIARYASFSFALLALAGIAAAQDQPHPWRSVDDPPPASLDQEPPPPAPDYQPNLNSRPDYAQGNGPAGQNNYPAPNQLPYSAPANVPARLTIKPGTYVTVRVNQWLSSDRNQPGDTFSATLDQPLVVDGLVVAQRGQTVTGRVTDAQKAGRVEGTSKLGIQLTDLTLVDGQTVSVQSQMINRNGSTSTGRDAAAIGTTTALGAIIGAGADWGRGAAIGAGAGAAAGIVGVLLTRGRPTVIYPESALTFRLEQPVTIATDRAPQAFQLAEREDYGRSPNFSSRPAAAPYPPAYAPAPAPYPAYGYPYPYYGGLSVYVGPRYGYFYGGGYRGYYRRR